MDARDRFLTSTGCLIPRRETLVTSPECWAVLDYAVLRSPHVRGDVTWEIREHRTAHGIGAWFDWDGVEGVTFSNSPLSGERHIFGQLKHSDGAAVERL